jgi:hypothetical protein
VAAGTPATARVSMRLGTGPRLVRLAAGGTLAEGAVEERRRGPIERSLKHIDDRAEKLSAKDEVPMWCVSG